MKKLSLSLCVLRLDHPIMTYSIFTRDNIDYFSFNMPSANFGNIECNDAKSSTKGRTHSIVEKELVLPLTAAANINKKKVFRSNTWGAHP